MPKARAMRYATASVGFARPRSISLSIERLTAQAADISSNVHPFLLRSLRTRQHRTAPTVSPGTGRAVRLAGVLRRLLLISHSPVYRNGIILYGNRPCNRL